MKLLEDILHRIHGWIQRREKPLELVGPFCPECRERIEEPAKAMEDQGELFHPECLLQIPAIWRRAQ